MWFSCEPTWRGYSELRQKIRAHTRDSCVVDSQAGYSTMAKLASKPVFSRAFTLVTGLALKAQPASAY